MNTCDYLLDSFISALALYVYSERTVKKCKEDQ